MPAPLPNSVGRASATAVKMKAKATTTMTQDLVCIFLNARAMVTHRLGAKRLRCEGTEQRDHKKVCSLSSNSLRRARSYAHRFYAWRAIDHYGEADPKTYTTAAMKCIQPSVCCLAQINTLKCDLPGVLSLSQHHRSSGTGRHARF